MLQDIVIGQFFPGNSFLHRMDPRVKILLLFLLMGLIFCCDRAGTYAVMTAFTIVMVGVSGVPPLTVLKSVRPLWWILIFTFFIHLFSHQGEEIGRFLGFSATAEGLRQGIFISLRLILLILLSSLLTFTTSPLKLTDAVERLLSPGRRIGIPAHELAMMMTIALRFIPTLIQETDKIIKAQTARGSDFSSGSLISRLRRLVPILVPLFLSAFRRADELAMAMEARCYRGGEGRTQMKELEITSTDYGACGGAVLLSGLIIFMGW